MTHAVKRYSEKVTEKDSILDKEDIEINQSISNLTKEQKKKLLDFLNGK
jgi:hypothetical protein